MQPTAPDAPESALAVADRAIATLARSLDGKPDDTPIQTDARSLRGLAAVLEELRAGLGRCCGADCFGRPENGVRTWVRHEALDRQAARADAAEARARRLEDALRAVAEASALPEGQHDMLWDWRAVADKAGALASAALTDRYAPPAPARVPQLA